MSWQSLSRSFHNFGLLGCAFSKLKQHRFLYLYRACLIVLVPVISLRVFLFSGGYYGYADELFPLSSIVSQNFVVALTPIPQHPFPFFRLFLTFPYYLFNFFRFPITILERVFILYTFIGFTFLAYLFANLTVREYEKRAGRLKLYQSEFVKLVIVLFIFSNFLTLNLNADGGTWADSIVLLFIAISLVLLISREKLFSSYVASGSLFGLSLFLNPDYAVQYLLCVFVVSIVLGIKDKTLKRRSVYYVVFVWLAIPSFLIIAYTSFIISPINTFSLQALGNRSYNLSEIIWASHNIYPKYVFVLLGYVWSTMTFGPPTILFQGNQISNMPYLFSPTQVLTPSGFITNLWWMSVFLIPIICLASLSFKRFWRFSIISVLIVIVGFIFTLSSRIHVIYLAASYLSRLPFVGSAVGTSFALPDHYISSIAIGYYFLIGIFSYSIFTTHEKIEIDACNNEKPAFREKRLVVAKMFRRIRRSLKATSGNRLFSSIAAIFVIFIVVFSGWQAFNGDYYPRRSNPGEYEIGNSIYPAGAYTGVGLNGSIISAYDLVMANLSGSNVIWIGGPDIPSFSVEMPSMHIGLSGFQYLIAGNLSVDALVYLQVHSVKYVVISNQDIVQGEPNPFKLWGFSDFNSTVIFFEKVTHLTCVYDKYETTIFQVPSVNNSSYISNLVVHTTGEAYRDGTLYNFIQQTLNKNISITKNSNSTSLGVNSKSDLCVLTPDELRKGVPILGIPVKYSSTPGNYFYNSTSINESENYFQNNSLKQYNHDIGKFTTTSWANNTTISFHSGAFSLSSNSNSTFSVDYNGSLAGTKGGIYVPNSSQIIDLKVRFNLNVSDRFIGTPHIDLIGEGKNAKTTYHSREKFNISSVARNYEFNTTFPASTRYIGFRIGFNDVRGTVLINYVNVSYENIAFRDSSTPFGSYAELNDSSLKFGHNISKVIMLTSSISDLSKLEYSRIQINSNVIAVSNKTLILGLLLVSNNYLSKNATSYLVYNSLFSKELYVKQGAEKLTESYVSVDGATIFTFNSNKGTPAVRIDSIEINLLRIGYVIDVAFLALLLSAVTIKRTEKRQSN